MEFKNISVLALCVCAVLYLMALPVGYFIFYTRYSRSFAHTRPGYGDVTIRRERSTGLPHIKCDSLVDCFYGFGRVHAQDRLFQMHLQKFFAQGRLAELVGEFALDTDIMMRQIGLQRQAQVIEQNMSNATRRLLQAYADGINDHVSGMWIMPLDFWVMSIHFEPWRLTDSITLHLYVAQQMSTDYLYEPLRTIVAQKWGEKLAARLFGIDDAASLVHDPVIISDEEARRMGLD